MPKVFLSHVEMKGNLKWKTEDNYKKMLQKYSYKKTTL